MQRNDVCTSHTEYLNDCTTDVDITNLLSAARGHDCFLKRFGHEWDANKGSERLLETVKMLAVQLFKKKMSPRG